MVYVDYASHVDYKKKDIHGYIVDRYRPINELATRACIESLHFWKDGELVYDLSLHMASDDEKGVYFETNDYILRPRNDAKFQVEKDRQFYVIYMNCKKRSTPKGTPSQNIDVLELADLA